MAVDYSLRDAFNAVLASRIGTSGLFSVFDGWKRTDAEIAAGVTPTNYSVLSHDVAKDFIISRYGATAGADNTTAINNANLVAVQAGGGRIKLDVDSLISSPVVLTAPNIVVDGCGRYQQFSPTTVKDSTHDWSPYYQMFVANADNIFFERMRCLGGIIVATSNYFPGSFIWYAIGVSGGGVERSYFQNLRYVGGSNNVAIQVRTSCYRVKIHHNDFVDCAGAVSHQGLHGTVTDNVAKITDAAAATPLTDTAGVFDQPFGIDGSFGNSVANNKVYLSSGAPYSGALIGANSTTTNFQIHGNEIYGLRGGVALYIRNSSNGKVYGNLIDGLGYTSTAAWCFLRVDADCVNVDTLDNTLRGSLVAGVGTGLGLDIYTGGHHCKDNKVYFGSSTTAVCLLQIAKATNPVETVYEGNYLQGGGIGTKLALTDNILASTGIEVPILHRNNTFATPITTPYSTTGANVNVKFYIEGDRILSSAYNASAVVLGTKLNRMFRNGLAANFWFSVGQNLEIHSTEVPTTGNYDGATYETGDQIYHSQTVAGGSEGWKCTTGGTIPYTAPYSQGGTGTNGSPIVTALANTTNVFVGDYVSPSARWATTGPYKVIAKTSTTLTLDTNANASGASTITHFAPVFKTLAVVAA